MIVYLDTSILLRLVLGESNAWADWPRMQRGYSCELLPIEVGRTIDRLRLERRIDDDGVVHLQSQTRAIFRSISLVSFDPAIRATAAGPMPTVIGTLDALHLASLLALRRAREPDLVLATHDRQLSSAARAFGVPVVGDPIG